MRSNRRQFLTRSTLAAAGVLSIPSWVSKVRAG
ncbi:MAG: hypothetical protein DRI83_07970, partial [Bacteroidetes bacterium]